MPYKKKTGPRRRKARAPARRRQRKMTMYKKPKMGTGIANAVFAKLKYVLQYSAAQPTPHYVLPFRGNSVYDPEQLLGGHQAMYFDQYMAIYDRYQVYASSIKVTVMNASTTSALQVIIWPSRQVTNYTNTEAVLEQTLASAAVTVPIIQQKASIIKRYATTQGVFGLSKAQLGESSYQGNIASNPQSQWYWNIFLKSSDGASLLAGNMLIELKYYTKFFERIMQSQS